MNRSRLVTGPALIAFGVLLLVERGGGPEAWGVVGRWWPTVVLLAAAAQVLVRPRQPVAGVILAAAGGVLLAWTLGTVDSLTLLWPLGLIGIGAWLLLRRPPTPPTYVEVEGEVVAVFDDRYVRAPAGPLEERSVTTVFGDLDLDLTAATIADDATLTVTTVFGDAEIAVPPGWRVITSGSQVFGEVEVDTDVRLDADAPVLRLRGTTLFGDVRVHTAAAAERVHGG